MRAAGLSPEQQEHVDRHIAGIGDNHGPALLEHQDAILEGAARHHRLRDELIGIRVMFDMLRSDIAGEYLLPKLTVGYIALGVSLAAAITGVSIAAQAYATLLLDAVVVGFIVAALHDQIADYVAWRAARDPSYAEVKRQLLDGGKS